MLALLLLFDDLFPLSLLHCADLLSLHSLLVDSANQRLLQAPSQHTHSSKKVSPSFHLTVNIMMNESVDIDDEPPTMQVSSTKSCSKNSSKNRFNALLSRFLSLTAPFQRNSKPRHSVRHHIHTNGPSIYARPRRLSPEMLKVVKAEFDKLLKQGIVSRSNSNWPSPLPLVKKADGTYRPCGDYHKLNSMTTRPTFSIPRLFDFVNNLKGSKIFSKIDLCKGYFHVSFLHILVTPFQIS